VRIGGARLCGSVPQPTFRLFVNGVQRGGTYTTGTSAQNVQVTLSPATYVHEVAIYFTNFRSALNGACVNLTSVDYISINGTQFQANDGRYAIRDRGLPPDGVDVEAASDVMTYEGAYRFFVAPSPLPRADYPAWVP